MTAFKNIGHFLMVAVLLVVIFMPGAGHVYADELAACEIPATCRISEDIPQDMDIDFMYTLKADGMDCPMPDGSDDGEKTVHMTDSGEVEFGKITFDHPDVFRYTLQETTQEEGAFRRDKTEYHAAVIAASDGNVRLVVNTDKGSKPEKIEFVNSYLDPVKTERKKAPRTGDTANIIKAFLMLLMSMAGLIVLAACPRCTNETLMIRTGSVGQGAGLKNRAGSVGHGTGLKEHAAPLLHMALIIIIVGIQWSCSGEAYAAVRSVSDYSELPVNNVEINSLDFNQAVFTSLNSKIKKTPVEYYFSSGNVTDTSIVWESTTKPKFGTSGATATQNANLAGNTVTGDLFTLRFNGAATLSDGTKKDVLMTFSDLYFGLSKSATDTSGTKYDFPIIRIDESGSGIYINSGLGIGTRCAGRIKGLRAATRIKTTIRIVEPGSDDRIGDMEYILGFRDLDVQDNTAATGDNIDRYAAHYSEGIGLISGYSEPVYLSGDTYIRQDTWDGVTKLRGTRGDNDSIKSGADIPVSTAGFAYYWYGSYHTPSSTNNPGGSMGTRFGYSPEVNVFASAGTGGTIEKPGETRYLVNSSTTYSYEPSPGYKVRKLVVDGEEVPFDKDGGTYTFSKLTETTEDGYDHTIEVTFHKPQDIIISKNVKGSLGDRKKAFEFTVTLSGMEEDTVFDISNASTGQFVDVYLYGTRLSSRKFRTSSGGRATLKLKMKDDQFIRLTGITGGARYSINEAKSDHIASYEMTGDGDDPVIVNASKSNSRTGSIATASETVDENDGTVRAAFINERNIAVPTGVRTERRPYVTAVIMIIFAALSVLIVEMVPRWNRRADQK